jgi:hypothetical protein
MLFKNENGEWEEGAVESEGLLYRVPYLVLPRVLLSSMSLEWQDKFMSLMDEMRAEWDWSQINDHYIVNTKKDGKFVHDELRDYRHFPNARIEALRISSEGKK